MAHSNLHHDTSLGVATTIAYGMGFAAMITTAFAVVFLLLVVAGMLKAEASDSEQIKRGKYLVTVGLCTDCHTPGYFFGKPDKARFLGGSEVGFHIPDLGVFHGPNLTPDNDTGLGRWSPDDIVKAIQTGTRPDGRVLAPVMPWHALAELTKEDAYAIAAFLKSLPPVSNKVPGPFGPTETPSSFTLQVVAPAQAGQ